MVTSALDDAGIAHVVLKGGALAFDIYDRPAQRPLGDLDVLVGATAGERAQALLRTLGFDVPTTPPRLTHHHLPAATVKRDGHTIAVEIHVDALSRDQPWSLTLALAGPTRTVTIGHHRVRAFGHADMLRHLTAHLLEPGDETRLLTVADLVGYADRYHAEIDWDTIRDTDRRSLTTLSLLHHLAPLPASLRAHVPAVSSCDPPGVGCGFPLPSVLSTKGPARALRYALYPSQWWMRAYYDVPSRSSLWRIRWGPHLRRLGYWWLRRVLM